MATSLECLSSEPFALRVTSRQRAHYPSLVSKIFFLFVAIVLAAPLLGRSNRQLISDRGENSVLAGLGLLALAGGGHRIGIAALLPLAGAIRLFVEEVIVHPGGTLASSEGHGGLALPAPVENSLALSSHQLADPSSCVSGSVCVYATKKFDQGGTVSAEQAIVVVAPEIVLRENSQTLVIRPPDAPLEAVKPRVLMVAEKTLTGTGFTAGVVGGNGYSLVEARGDINFYAAKHAISSCQDEDWFGRCTARYEAILVRPPQFLGAVWVRSLEGKVKGEALMVIAPPETTTRIDASKGLILRTEIASVHAFERGLASRGSAYHETAVSPTVTNNLILSNKEGPVVLDGLVMGGRNLKIDAPGCNVEFTVPRLVSMSRYKGLTLGLEVSALVNIFQMAMNQQAQISSAVHMPLLDNVQNAVLPGNPAALQALNAYAAAKEAMALVSMMQNPTTIPLVYIGGRLTYVQSASFAESAGPRVYDLDRMEVIARNMISSGVFFRTRQAALSVYQLVFEGLCFSSTFTNQQASVSLGASFSLLGPSITGSASCAASGSRARVCLPGGLVSDLLDTSAESIHLRHAAFKAHEGRMPANVRVSLETWQDLYRSYSYSASLGMQGGSFAYANEKEAKTSFVSVLHVGSTQYEDTTVLADERISQRGAAHLQLFYDVYEKLRPQEAEAVVIEESSVQRSGSRGFVEALEEKVQAPVKASPSRRELQSLTRVKGATLHAESGSLKLASTRDLLRTSFFSRNPSDEERKACDIGIKEGLNNIWDMVRHPDEVVHALALTVKDIWQLAHPRMAFPTSSKEMVRIYEEDRAAAERMRERGKNMKQALREYIEGDSVTKKRMECAVMTETVLTAGLGKLVSFAKGYAKAPGSAFLHTSQVAAAKRMSVSEGSASRSLIPVTPISEISRSRRTVMAVPIEEASFPLTRDALWTRIGQGPHIVEVRMSRETRAVSVDVIRERAKSVSIMATSEISRSRRTVMAVPVEEASFPLTRDALWTRIGQGPHIVEMRMSRETRAVSVDVMRERISNAVVVKESSLPSQRVLISREVPITWLGREDTKAKIRVKSYVIVEDVQGKYISLHLDGLYANGEHGVFLSLLRNFRREILDFDVNRFYLVTEFENKKLLRFLENHFDLTFLEKVSYFDSCYELSVARILNVKK